MTGSRLSAALSRTARRVINSFLLLPASSGAVVRIFHLLCASFRRAAVIDGHDRNVAEEFVPSGSHSKLHLSLTVEQILAGTSKNLKSAFIFSYSKCDSLNRKQVCSSFPSDFLRPKTNEGKTGNIYSFVHQGIEYAISGNRHWLVLHLRG